MTLGPRWELWLRRWRLYLLATGLTDATKIKSTFLLLIGEEAYNVYETLKKEDDSDTIEELYEKLTKHFVSK